MELTIYKKKKPHAPGLKSVMRILSANRKGAFFSINVRLMLDLGLTGGERVLIAKDDDSRNDWYMTAGADVIDGSKTRPMGQGKSGRPVSMRFQNKGAVEALLDSVKADYSASFIVATRPTRMKDGRDWYRILTATPRQKR